MAQRFVEGIGHHEKLSAYSYGKYEKRSPLGQLQSLYNVEPCRPFLSVRLPVNFDPTNRENVTASLERSQSQTKQNTVKRLHSAPVWVKVPNHTEMWESCALSEAPKPRRVVFSSPRPNTVSAGIQHKTARNKKSGRARARDQTCTLYRFRPVNIGAQCSRENIELCTSLIKEQWDSKQRQYLKTGVYARGRPEAKDHKLMQWFTFEGQSPGALSAFTKGSEQNTGIDSPKFSIEANVGKEVAAKLVLGGTVKIGKNGELIGGAEHFDENDDSIFHDRCNAILTMTRGASQKHEPLYAPLCWSDVEKEARVLAPTPNSELSNTDTASRTVPVVYNTRPNIKPYIPTGSQSDKERLDNLLSRPVSKKHREEATLTYEEVLESRAPDSSRGVKSGRQLLPTREGSDLGLAQTTSPISRTYKHPKQASAKLVNKTGQVRGAKTPTIPDEVRCGIRRQVTMPAYKIIPAQPPTKVAGRPNTGQEPHERIATPNRPPRYIPAYNSNGGTTPTISQHGVEGDRSYVTITTPMNQLFKCDEYNSKDMAAQKREFEQNSRKSTLYLGNTTGYRINTTPADVSLVTLVGKAPPIDRHERSCRSNPKPAAPSTATEVTGLQLSEQSDVLQEGANFMSEDVPVASRLDISIPVVDMISASSATVNSLADFHEFDNLLTKNTVEVIEDVSDVNNNAVTSEDAKVASPGDPDDVMPVPPIIPDTNSQIKPPSIASFDDDPDFSISVDIGVRPTSKDI